MSRLAVREPSSDSRDLDTGGTPRAREDTAPGAAIGRDDLRSGDGLPVSPGGWGGGTAPPETSRLTGRQRATSLLGALVGALLAPVAICLVGLPVVLAIRIVVEIGRGLVSLLLG